MPTLIQILAGADPIIIAVGELEKTQKKQARRCPELIEPYLEDEFQDRDFYQCPDCPSDSNHHCNTGMRLLYS